MQGHAGHTVTMLRLLLYLSALEFSIGVLFLCCIPSYWIRIAPPVTILWVYAWPLHAGLDIMAISPNYLWSWIALVFLPVIYIYNFIFRPALSLSLFTSLLPLLFRSLGPLSFAYAWGSMFPVVCPLEIPNLVGISLLIVTISPAIASLYCVACHGWALSHPCLYVYMRFPVSPQVEVISIVLD